MNLTTFKKLGFGLATAMIIGTISGASAEKLRVGMECTYAPFNYKTADGDLAGYDVDVAGRRLFFPLSISTSSSIRVQLSPFR